MKRLLSLSATIGLLFSLAPGSVFSQALSPSRAELENIVFNVETPVDIDDAETAELRAWLENEVGQFMDAGRLAPLYVKLGFRPKHGWKAFTEPAETFYALSLAYPFLSPDLQNEVSDFLAQEFVDYPPHKVSRYPMDGPDFARRERSYLPDEKKTSEGDDVRNGHMLSRLYPVWAYAHYTGNWAAISGEWPEIKAIFNSFVGSYTCSTDSEDENMNRYVSGLIGYIRIAHQMGDGTEVDRGLDELERIIPNRLASARWRGDQAAYYLDEYGCTGYGRCPGEGMFIIGRNASPKLYQFWDLTPEVGRLLGTYAPEAMQASIDFIDRDLTGWYVVNGEITVSAGDYFLENRVDYPHVSLQFFQLMAFIDRRDGDTLKLYANAPMCVGDLYHLQKLAHAIQAYGTPCYDDLRTPRNECGEIGGGSMSVSSDTAAHGDVLTYTLSLLGTGQPITVVNSIPSSLTFVPNSAEVTPEIGTLSVNGNTVLRWVGTPAAHEPLQVTFRAVVTSTGSSTILNTAFVDYGGSTAEFSALVIVNGYEVSLPLVVRNWSAQQAQQGTVAPDSSGDPPTRPEDSPTEDGWPFWLALVPTALLVMVSRAVDARSRPFRRQ